MADPTPAEIEAAAAILRIQVSTECWCIEWPADVAQPPTPTPCDDCERRSAALARSVLTAVLPDHDAQVRADELREQLEHARADRQDLWDTRDKRNHRWMEAAERLTEERDAARAEAEREQAARVTWMRRAEEARAELAEVTAERDRLERLTAADRETVARLRAELATARRDGAADQDDQP